MAGALSGRAAGRGAATGRRGRFVVVAAVAFLLPVYLFDHELIAPEGKADHGPGAGPAARPGLRAARVGNVRPAAARLFAALGLDFASAVAGHEWRRRRIAQVLPSGGRVAGPGPPRRTSSVSAWVYAGLVWLGRRRRLVAGLVLAAMAAIIMLDVRGYSFTARRLAIGGSQTAVAIAVAVGGLPRNCAGDQPERLAMDAPRTVPGRWLSPRRWRFEPRFAREGAWRDRSPHRLDSAADLADDDDRRCRSTTSPPGSADWALTR